jgi:hypothetical protein
VDDEGNEQEEEESTTEADPTLPIQSTPARQPPEMFKPDTIARKTGPTNVDGVSADVTGPGGKEVPAGNIEPTIPDIYMPIPSLLASTIPSENLALPDADDMDSMIHMNMPPYNTNPFLPHTFQPSPLLGVGDKITVNGEDYIANQFGIHKVRRSERLAVKKGLSGEERNLARKESATRTPKRNDKEARKRAVDASRAQRKMPLNDRGQRSSPPPATLKRLNTHHICCASRTADAMPMGF